MKTLTEDDVVVVRTPLCVSPQGSRALQRVTHRRTVALELRAPANPDGAVLRRVPVAYEEHDRAAE